MKQALIIRAHSLKKPLVNIVNQAREQEFPIFLAVDESDFTFPNTVATKISLTTEKLGSLALPQVPNCFWLMGDYALYICRSELENYDYYWMIEQDVCVNFEKIELFFNLFADSRDDLLAPELEKIDSDWWTWTETMQPFVGQTWRCFFPVTRLSGRAIDYLYRRRISTFKYIEEMKAKGGSQLRVPNDEAFVSSELCEAGFSCKDLNFYEQDLYCRDTFRFRKPIPEIFFRNNPPDNRIYHPVVDDNDFIAVLKKRFQFLEQRHDMNRLKNETDYGKLGKLKDLIQKYFGPSAVNTLEQECPTLLNTWS